MTIRILASSPLVGPALGELGRRFPDLLITPRHSEAWHAAWPTAEAAVVLLSEPVSPEELAAAPRLKALGTYSVGVNHLPVEACRSRRIRVVNTPDVLTDATADLALTLLLALSRRVAEGEALVRSRTWTGWEPTQLLGVGLAGKTCGILGAGPIGRAFARRVSALGMQPLFWDREGHGTPVDLGPGTAARAPLEVLLPRSDVLSLHCPLTPETRGLLSAQRLALLPPGAMVINTARGGILDEPAVIAMLHAGTLGGVGLDVYANEPRLHEGWFTAPRTVLLPHVGSATTETRAAMAETLCQGLAAALQS